MGGATAPTACVVHPPVDLGLRAAAEARTLGCSARRGFAESNPLEGNAADCFAELDVNALHMTVGRELAMVGPKCGSARRGRCRTVIQGSRLNMMLSAPGLALSGCIAGSGTRWRPATRLRSRLRLRIRPQQLGAESHRWQYRLCRQESRWNASSLACAGQSAVFDIRFRQCLLDSRRPGASLAVARAASDRLGVVHSALLEGAHEFQRQREVES